MKKAVFVACACIMFLSVIFTGCEDEVDEDGFGWGDYSEDTESAMPESDCISVTVQAQVIATIREYVWHEDTLGWVEPYPYVLYDQRVTKVSIKCTKSGGENYALTRDAWAGETELETLGTFKVYKEQFVDVEADIIVTKENPNLIYEYSGDYQSFSWERMWEAAGEEFGGSCTLAAYLTVVTHVYFEPGQYATEKP